MSLKQPNMKMSKSHDDPRSRILISDKPEEIKTKIRLAMTDSLPGVSYEPSTRPGVSNLVSIMSFLDKENRSCEELASLHKNLNMRQFKDEICKSIDTAISGIRDKYESLVQGGGQQSLDDIARQGAMIANQEAQATMANVKEAVGLS